VKRLEGNRGRFAPRLARSGIGIRTGQFRYEEGPARKPEELHDGREHTDHDRRGDNSEAVAGEHLSHEDDKRREQTAVSMKPYQRSFRPTPPAWKRLRMSSVELRRMSG
jgi:hypothetical protein